MRAVVAPEAPWQKRMASLAYSKSAPSQGVAAMKTLDDWLVNGLEPEANTPPLAQEGLEPKHRHHHHPPVSPSPSS